MAWLERYFCHEYSYLNIFHLVDDLKCHELRDISAINEARLSLVRLGTVVVSTVYPLWPSDSIWCHKSGVLCNIGYPPETYLNPECHEILFAHNLIFSYPIILNFMQSMAVILPCSGQNFEMIGQLKRMFWMNEICKIWVLRDLSSGQISYIAQPPWNGLDHWFIVWFSLLQSP